MRRLVAIEFITLDGVIQGPGGPDEDTSDGFEHGGWIAPYTDAAVGSIVRQQMDMPFDLLLGRRTFEIWAPYWPRHADVWPGANSATKYVASRTMTEHVWGPNAFLNGDVAAQVAEVKGRDGPDLHVYGSANLLQTLMAHDLVDAFWLRIHPITLGRGKRLFDGGSIPAAFRLTDSVVTSTGVIAASYERAGAIPPAGG
jgi:dihydrofolate reductase